MPELPEVAAHAERLHERYAGAALAGFTPLSFTALKTFEPPPDRAVGLTLSQVDHRGKHLLLRFGDLTFVVHLMQGGRLREDTSKSRRPRGRVARWTFDDGRALLLTEAGTERKAGIWVIAGDPHSVEPLTRLGPEADTVDAAALRQIAHDHRMRLHGLLRQQRLMAGLGRRLANEICHRARMSPFQQSARLDDDDADRIVASIRSAVHEDLESERARKDMSASRERPAAVHNRTGEPCPVCGDTVREVAYRAYTVHYCATCQTGGKVLADNTTSKFLK